MPKFKKSSGFKMTGSPHKTGVIEGTSGHASAFKQVDLSSLRPDEPEELTGRDKYYDELNEAKFQEIVDAAKAKEEKLGSWGGKWDLTEKYYGGMMRDKESRDKFLKGFSSHSGSSISKMDDRMDEARAGLGSGLQSYGAPKGIDPKDIVAY